jgi:hypothetical protein
MLGSQVRFVGLLATFATLIALPAMASSRGGTIRGQPRGELTIKPPGDRAVWLVDDFEDGDLDGWYQAGTSYTVSNTAAQAALGLRSMEIYGGCTGPGEAVFTILGGFNATEISLYMRDHGTFNADCYLRVGDDTPCTAWDWGLLMFAGGEGRWKVFTDGTWYDCGERLDETWYLIQFEIDWQSRLFSVLIDGTPRQINLPFFSDTITTLTQLRLWNYNNSTCWIDHILMDGEPPEGQIFRDAFETGDTSRWSATIS